LKYLDVSCTSINLAIFQYDLFIFLEQLICVETNDVVLDRIPYELVKYSSLTRLELTLNNSNCEKLSSNMSSVFPNLKNLTTLVLDSCGEIPLKFKFKALSCLKKLRKLELGCIECTTNEFPEVFYELTQLTHLNVNLHMSGSPVFSKSFSKLSNLEEFTLFNYHLTYIPKIILSMKRLTVLNLPDSPIYVIDPEIGATKIARLEISHADIDTSSMKTLLTMSSLEFLFVFKPIHEKMKSLPEYEFKTRRRAIIAIDRI